MPVSGVRADSCGSPVSGVPLSGALNPLSSRTRKQRGKKKSLASSAVPDLFPDSLLASRGALTPFRLCSCSQPQSSPWDLTSEARASAPSPRPPRQVSRQASRAGECWSAPILCVGISPLCSLHPCGCALLRGSEASPLRHPLSLPAKGLPSVWRPFFLTTHSHWRRSRPYSFIFFNFFKNLFIYFWLCCVFVSVQELSPGVASGGHSSLWCAGLSLLRPLSLQSTGSRCAGSVVVAHGLSCSAACGIFPDQGSNPCPALAGRFPTTAPPGKPSSLFFCLCFFFSFFCPTQVRGEFLAFWEV